MYTDQRRGQRENPSASGGATGTLATGGRCWLLHRWGPWTPYEAVRPMRCIGPSLRHVTEVTEMRRQRRCRRCDKRDDRLIEQKLEPRDAPTERFRGFARIGGRNRVLREEKPGGRDR